MSDPSATGIDRREWIQKQLAKLDMVQWDRLVVGEDYHGDRYVNVYGWIGREHDEYKDFVLLQCWPRLGENGILGFTTSSDEHTREIYRRLFGDEPGHNDCQRVEDTFEIENAVELDPTEQRTLTDGGTPSCQLCEPAPHENCEGYTQVTIQEPRSRESADVWVCLEHYEAIEEVVI